MKKQLGFYIILFCLTFSFNSLFAQETHRLYQHREQTKDTRIYYSVFVQSFYDSNGDGIGDINGLISKLDYIKDLGVGGIWLLPVHPSPTYHKYDVVDYRGIHPDYGTIDDYKRLIKEAHKRDLKVLLDLVINHSSNHHKWFQEASKRKKSSYRDYYVWSDSEEDFKKEPFHWHQVRDENGKKLDGERYYGFFWWEMPDLNLGNRKVRKEIIDIGKFWLDDIGVDGFRLDAIKYVFPENRKKQNFSWWEDFRDGLGKDHKDDFIVAEIWGSSEEVAPYLGSGISAGFNFQLADSIKQSLIDGNNHSIVETIDQIYQRYYIANENFEDATFLSNHDMDRIMTVVGGNEFKAKAAATLLLSLPGNPFIYYGEEIGMLGEKPDEFIREPFLWNIEGEDPGQTHWELPFSSNSNTVKPLKFQKTDPRSIYYTYKDLIQLRNESPGLRFGELANLKSGNKHVVSFTRKGQLDSFIVIINLSSEMQRIKLPISLNNYESVFKSHPVFKGTDEEIALQPYSSFILKKNRKQLD